jgi:hypothetical protein
LGRSRSPTISAAKVCLTGASSAAAEPDRKASRHVPELDDARDGERSLDERKGAHGCLGEHEELALIEAVGSRAGPGQEQEERGELQAHDDAERGRIVMGELREDEPVLRDALHPGAGVGDEAANSPQAEVEAPEGAECAGDWVHHVWALMVGPSWAGRGVAPVKLAEMTCGKDADEQRAEAEREDVASGPRMEIADMGHEQIRNGSVEESPENVDR